MNNNHFKILQIFLISLSINHVKLDENCGQLMQSNDTNLSGANWPWLASLFYYFNGQYFCSGTLISNRHILTAARCFSGFNYSTPHQQVFVILGHNNLTNISPFEQIRNVTNIKLHPNFKKIAGNYDSDIAVLTLSDPVTITEYVQPNCLPTSTKKSESEELNDLRVTGTIAGYKKSHNSHQISFFESKVENITSCLFGDDSSCSIYSDEFNCNSVSGSGFYAQNNSSTAYKIYGIFSKGINKNESEFCGLNNFVIFIFVAQYVDWIKAVINEPFLGQKRTGKELKASSEIFCDYRWNYDQSDPVYTCIIRGFTIPSPYTELSSNISGLHGEDDSDLDVNRIHITKSNTIYLPDMSKLSKKFPNVKNLWVSKSNLEFVERPKLQSLTNLTILCFNENAIEEFADDTFVDMVNLEILWIYSNKITDLSEILFRNLSKLKIIDARNNLIKYLPSKLFSHNPNLKVVNFSYNSLKKIDIDFSEFKSIKWIVFDNNECIKVSYCKIFDCLKSLKQLQGVIDKDC